MVDRRQADQTGAVTGRSRTSLGLVVGGAEMITVAPTVSE
jgi:hypothetical protein